MDGTIKINKLPNSLKICGIKFNIVEVPVVSKIDYLKGQINFLTNTILIDETMPIDLKVQVLIHELIHVICDLSGNYEIGENEKAVQSIATTIYCLLAENNLLSFS